MHFFLVGHMRGGISHGTQGVMEDIRRRSPSAPSLLSISFGNDVLSAGTRLAARLCAILHLPPDAADGEAPVNI